MGEVLGSRFNLSMSLLYDRRSCKARIFIVATKGKMMEFNHIACFYFVYILSSYFMHYSICYELNTKRGKYRSALKME